LKQLERWSGAAGVLATGHLYFGAIDRYRGDLLRTMGRPDDAVVAYRRAIEADTAMGAVGFAARAQLGLAHALLAQGETAAATEAAAQVAATAERLGFPKLAEQARDLR